MPQNHIDWATISQIASALATIIIAFLTFRQSLFNKKQLDEMTKAREEMAETRRQSVYPKLQLSETSPNREVFSNTFSFDALQDPKPLQFYFELTNIGKDAACNIKILKFNDSSGCEWNCYNNIRVNSVEYGRFIINPEILRNPSYILISYENIYGDQYLQSVRMWNPDGSGISYDMLSPKLKEGTTRG